MPAIRDSPLRDAILGGVARENNRICHTSDVRERRPFEFLDAL
jgi:hypothetical protein